MGVSLSIKGIHPGRLLSLQGKWTQRPLWISISPLSQFYLMANQKVVLSQKLDMGEGMKNALTH